jgi:hypothetical protein
MFSFEQRKVRLSTLMFGTQQVGEYARLPRIGYGFAAVSILMLVKLLIEEHLVTRCKYIPTHLLNF